MIFDLPNTRPDPTKDELLREIATLEAKLKIAVEALNKVADGGDCSKVGCGHTRDDSCDFNIAREALSTLEAM